MPTVEYEGKSYKVRSRKTAIPDLAAMHRIEALIWLNRNTTARGYSRATDPLAGYGGVIKVRS